MIRLLVFLLGSLSVGRPGGRQSARSGPPGGNGQTGPGYGDQPGPVATQPLPDHAQPPAPPGAGGPQVPAGYVLRRRRRISRWLSLTAILVVIGLIFRRAIASLVLMALSAALHLIGVNVHLPHIKFGWPWQSIGGTTTNTDLGPWVLQKIQGISRPALGQANFSFVFTHRVSKNIGPWPCWYSSTFYAVGHASATVTLNPGPAWWKPSTGHYRLRVLSQPGQGKSGQVAITMALPAPQLPQSAHNVSIDNIPSKPIATDHSWTYPGLGCGVALRPQFQQSVLYAQAQRIAFSKATHSPSVTRPLIAAAEGEAQQTIRDNFIQPTVNAFGYRLDRLTIRWVAAR